MPTYRIQSHIEALAVLGLQPGACHRRIVRAYRRLAMAHHPDRAISRGDGPVSLESSRRRFAEITAAYATLERYHSAISANRRIEVCTRCGDLEELFTGLDGNGYCHTCLTHGHLKKALPAPPLQIVWGGIALALIGAAALALLVYIQAQQLVYWWASVLAGAAGIAYLARLCVQVGFCAERASRSPGSRRRRFSRAVRRIASNVPRHRSRLGRS